MYKVIVLLSTYNGEKYLHKLLNSVLCQEKIDLYLYIRDDGSTDKTIEIIRSFENNSNISWYKGHNLGPINSFFELIEMAPDGDYYCLCDQDDYWHSDKVITGIEHLTKDRNEMPQLYYSSLNLVDSLGNHIVNKNINNHRFKFGESLLRNNATGCTMIFNSNLRDKIKLYRPKNVLMHDHWILLLCNAVDGFVYYDKISKIDYLIHDNNYWGVSTGLKTIFTNSSLKKHKNMRSNIALQLYQNYKGSISEYKTTKLLKLINYDKNFHNKLSLIFDKEIKTHNLFSNLLLIYNILFNKL